MSGLIETRVNWVGTDSQGTLIRHTAKGQIHSMKQRVKLTAENGQWYTMGVKNAESGEYENKKVITAKGYKTLASIIGITFVTPDTITDENGNVVGNPFIHKAGNAIDWVKVRMIGICRGPSGNMQARDLTFVYNFQAYLAASLYAKWHNKKTNAVQPWGELISVNNTAPCPPNKIRVPVGSDVSLEVDLKNPNVVSIYREHLEQQKFAERNAIAMAERNIIQKMTGLHYVGEDDTVLVTIWPQGDTDLPRLGEMVQRAKTGLITVEDTPISVVKDKAEATDEDVAVTNENDETEAEDAEIEPVQPKVRDQAAALADFRAMFDSIPEHPEKKDQKKNLVKAALKLHGFSGLGELAKPTTTVEQIDKVTDSIRVTL